MSIQKQFQARVVEKTTVQGMDPENPNAPGIAQTLVSFQGTNPFQGTDNLTMVARGIPAFTMLMSEAEAAEFNVAIYYTITVDSTPNSEL